VKTSVMPQRRDLQQQNRHCSRYPYTFSVHQSYDDLSDIFPMLNGSERNRKRRTRATALRVFAASPGREPIDLTVWMSLDDPCQDVSKINAWINVVDFGDLDQRRDEGPAFGATVRDAAPRRRHRFRSEVYAAFFVSRSAFHSPLLASEFIRARWVKARWPAAMFSALPDQAFCGAACSARP
jgi:hypothetical protein